MENTVLLAYPLPTHSNLTRGYFSGVPGKPEMTIPAVRDAVV